MPLPKEQAWFPRKRHGFGWSLPCKWQGWLSLIGYVSVVAVNHYVIGSGRQYTLLFTFLLTILFVILVYVKGEKPSWQWGGDK